MLIEDRNSVLSLEMADESSHVGAAVLNLSSGAEKVPLVRSASKTQIPIYAWFAMGWLTAVATIVEQNPLPSDHETSA